MTDTKRKQTPTSADHEGALHKLASKVNPTKLFSNKDKDKKDTPSHSSISRKSSIDKQQHPRKLSVEFSIPSDHDDNESIGSRNPTENHDTSFHDLTSLHSTHQQHSLRARSKSTSSLTGPKLEYNPYGIYNHHNLQRLGSAFGNGTAEKNESETILPQPTATPNDHLPEFFQEDIQYLEEKYELSDKNLGCGGSATIKKIFIKNDSNNSESDKTRQFFALKKFSIYTGESQDKYYNRVATEYSITRAMQHLHTIRCYELLQLPITLQRAWGMVLEFYNYDLYKLIKSSSWKNVPFNEKMCVFKQICFGLKFIHEQDIAHLDIKADNVMVAKNGIMKITDYGCSEIGHEEYGNFQSKVALKTTRLGTPPYQPPEVAKYGIMDKKEARQPYCPFKFDYWSLGLLLYVIVFGKIPFNTTKDSDSGYQLFKAEYTFHLETNPLFVKDLSTKIPKTGAFGDPHGHDPNLIYLFWRLCDPNPKTRMTLPKLFHNKFFQNLEMCVDERLYECNFCKHTKSKQLKFEIPLGDNKEITLQNEIKHSSWDDIPTVCSIHQKYDSLVSDYHTTNNDEGIVILPPSEHAQHQHFNSTTGLPVVNECEDECGCEIEECEKRSDSDTNYTISRGRSSISTRSSFSISSKQKTNTENNTSSQHGKVITPTYLSVCRKTTKDPSSFKYPEKARKSYFSQDDYQDGDTKFMIVNFDDICDACNYNVVPHSHNVLYSYKK